MPVHRRAHARHRRRPERRPASRRSVRAAGTGWVEGRNVAIEYRWAEGDHERLPALAAELVALSVDVIWPRRHALRRLLPSGDRDHSDRVRDRRRSGRPGLVASLARPGGNVTGFHLIRIRARRQNGSELLKELRRM